MDLKLQAEEVQLLREVLERHVSNLRMEVAGTESYDMREALKKDEETLKSIIQRLAAGG